MTTAEAYESVAPIAIASARRVAPRRLRTDPDFLQDVRLRLWRAVLHASRRGRLDNLKPMACVVGRNAATDHLIRLRPLGYREAIVHAAKAPEVTPHGDIDEFSIEARPAPDPFAVADMLTRLERADLTTAELVSVLLGYAQGWTQPEIAGLFGFSLPAAKRLRASALDKVRKAVA